MIMPKNQRFDFPYSRDWGYSELPCRCTDCPANVCNHCTVPSLINIGPDGVCETGKKYIDEKSKNRTMDKKKKRNTK